MHRLVAAARGVVIEARCGRWGLSEDVVKLRFLGGNIVYGSLLTRHSLSAPLPPPRPPLVSGRLARSRLPPPPLDRHLLPLIPSLTLHLRLSNQHAHPTTLSTHIVHLHNAQFIHPDVRRDSTFDPLPTRSSPIPTQVTGAKTLNKGNVKSVISQYFSTLSISHLYTSPPFLSLSLVLSLLS